MKDRFPLMVPAAERRVLPEGTLWPTGRKIGPGNHNAGLECVLEFGPYHAIGACVAAGSGIALVPARIRIHMRNKS
jgi:hypothetical protein